MQLSLYFKYINHEGDFMRGSLYMPNGSGLGLSIFLIGIVILIIYLFIYTKKQKNSKRDSLEKKSQEKDIPKNEPHNKNI